MVLHNFDLLIFVLFIGLVVVFSMFKIRRETNREGYFLAGRDLKWWVIGFSIVAANISTEQFVGMSGSSAGNVGLAISGYQLLGTVTIVFVAIFLLPKFLRAGIFTMPEYLEYRYHRAARGIMAFYMMVIYVAVTITAVLYSGAITLHTIFDMQLTHAVWLIGIVAAVYTTWGGLKAVAYADLIQGSSLLIAGLLTMVLGFLAIGATAPATAMTTGLVPQFLNGVRDFHQVSASRLLLVLPADHPELPWTALLFGLWIPNIYYTGLNQFIVQRTLAAKSLRHGQLGILFAASLWLLVPFAIVLPGMMSLQLYGHQFTTPDQAYPTLIRNLIPVGVRGFIFAALAGAIISSIASMLNSAATIFTIDLYQNFWKKNASEKSLVILGRGLTLIFVLIGCLIAPQLSNPRFGGVFKYIQEFQGYISPGIVAVFLFGFLVKRAPAAAGVAGLLVGAPVYGFLQWQFNQIAFLNRMALTFFVVIAVMTVITLIAPLTAPKKMPVKSDFDLQPSKLVLILGGLVILGVISIYVIFW